MKYTFLWLLAALTPAWGQAPLPADCPTIPAAPDAQIQVEVPFNSRRLGSQPGYAMLAIPLSPGGTTCQAAEPALPDDVLHGTPDTDLLRGTGPADVLHNRDPPPQTSGNSTFIDVR
jgi:hypothetical protein